MHDGVVAPGWTAVRDAFAETLELDRGEGASLCITVDGRTVVDLWGGADPLSGSPFARDSVTIAFSVSKGVAAIALLQLVDRGLVDLDAPVATYWPEFAASGKGAITVREVVSHRAGLPVIELDPLTRVVDWELATSTLAAQAPQYDTTRFFAYHALSFGFLVGEIVRRVSGLPFADYVQQHIAGPLRLDLWVGQPASAEPQYLPSITDDVDAAPAVPVPEAPGICRAVALSAVQLLPLFRRVDGVLGSEPFNRPEFRAASIPAGNVVTNARSVARMYAACLNEVDGVRLVSEGLIAEAARDQAAGIRKPACRASDPWATGVPQVWGLGFEISNYENPMLGEGSFGHSGMGGRLGFAQLGSGVSFGYVSQRMLYPPAGSLDPRSSLILAAISEVLGA
ncbi:serine hydrolase domain-containing protein [Schumannella luteola]